MKSLLCCAALFASLPLLAHAAVEAEPGKPLVLGHISVGENDYYLPLPRNYSTTAQSTAAGGDGADYVLHAYPDGQSEQNWSERLTLAVFKPELKPLDNTRVALIKGCNGVVSNYVAPIPILLSPLQSSAAQVMNCSESGQAGGPTIYGYYLTLADLQHGYLLKRERREQAPNHYADWGAHEVDNWRRALAGFTVCAKGVVCIRYPEKTTVVELVQAQ